MATAVVTGASSGIGRVIAIRLLEMGYKVIGLSRRCNIDDENYKHITIDLTDTQAIEDAVAQLEEVSLLINSAGFGVFEPHEEISAKTIEQMITLNLHAPILLTNLLLRKIKKSEGSIIFITSIEAIRSSKFAALYSATKAGLRAFSLSLFEELRKSKVNTLVINPDMTHTEFFDSLRFEPQKALLASDIADVVENTLNMRKGASINEVTVRAQEFGIKKKIYQKDDKIK